MLKRTTTTATVTAQQARGGFTLMEMLVVVAIIVIIAGAATTGVIQYLAQAKNDRAKLDIKKLETAVIAFNLKHGYYPQSLQQLTAADDQGNPPVLGPADLLDPWNQPYQYNSTQLNPRGVPVISSGGAQGNAQNLNNQNN